MQVPIEELCVEIYRSMGICKIFKLLESQVDVSYKDVKWLLKILS